MEPTDNLTTPDNGFSYISPIGHSFYARATSLSPAFYQSLVDRCWRRSGSLLYRPNQQDACCPHYTLRLDSSQCRVSKAQRQAINRFNKYVTGDTYAKEAAHLYPRSRDDAKKRDTEFNLVERIHEAETQSLRTPPQPDHVFQVTLESDEFTEEKYAVFENYQRVVHHEGPSDISREGFKRFLCDSPLSRGTFTSPDGKVRRLGSFHQCYRLDGQLVAIGVLDLLPNCVSAVYFLYHESIHKFQPGKIGALREIALAAEQGYQWWYSGFYIHTCPKMRYKIDFAPQYVLDPDKLSWVGLDKDVLALFDDKGYLHLSRESSGQAEPSDDLSENSAEGTASLQNEVDSDDDDLPLFESKMPGIPSLDLMRHFPLDDIPVCLSRGVMSAGDLFQWYDEDIGDPTTAKGMVAALAAVVGPDLMLQWALDFRRS